MPAKPQVQDRNSDVCEVFLENLDTYTPTDSSAENWKGTTVYLDTNVLLLNPKAIYDFPGATVVISGIVLEEIDKFKKDPIRQYEARTTLNLLDDLATRGNFRDGVIIDSYGTTLRLSFHVDPSLIPAALDKDSKDNLILAQVKGEMLKQAKAREAQNVGKVTTPLELSAPPARNVILVTQDRTMRLKANGDFEVKAEPYHSSILHDSRKQQNDDKINAIDITSKQKNLFLKERAIPWNSEGLFPNQYVKLVPPGTSGPILARYSEGNLVPLTFANSIENLRVAPRNEEQTVALDLLLNPDIPLVTISGGAGSGKTFLAMLAALYQTYIMKDPVYKDVLISRNVTPLGDPIGFLPGKADEKINPYLAPFYDNFDEILSIFKKNGAQMLKEVKKERASNREIKKAKAEGTTPQRYDGPVVETKEIRISQELERIRDADLIKVEVLTFIRGRSLSGQVIIIDEAQNLTYHEVKTILTRVGQGTKIILLGDWNQIDNPYLTMGSNGLSIVSRIFRDSKLAGHVTLHDSVRSEFVKAANQIFADYERKNRK